MIDASRRATTYMLGSIGKVRYVFRSRLLAVIVFICLLILNSTLRMPVHAAQRNADYQPLGYWAHICVLAREGTDETITFASDDTWADYQCGYVPANSQGDLSPISQDPALRPGSIECAFIQRYSGEWQSIIPIDGNYQAGEGTGQTQIAVRAAFSTQVAAMDCGSLWQWIDEQNTINGFTSYTSGGGTGGGGACSDCGGTGGGGAIAPPKAHKAQKPLIKSKKHSAVAHCTAQHHPKGCKK